jgi:uncharacterized membrane protein YeaQ/YmgE (transglycosylase-associated protein family)
MSIWEFLVLLVVAGICGALGQAIAGVSRGGCIVSIALGFIGALIGMALLSGSWLSAITYGRTCSIHFPLGS